MGKKIAKYGTWPSPVSESHVAAGSVRLGHVVAARFGGETVTAWLESRPSEGGRGVVAGVGANGQVFDLTDPQFSVRSRVHEYGGGALFAGNDRTLYFINAADQQIYQLNDGGAVKLTDVPSYRFADGSACFRTSRIFAVAEKHDGDHDPEPENSIQRIEDGAVHPACGGADFYAAPRISPDGAMLAWLQWNLPHMPWEAAELHLGRIDENGHLQDQYVVAGGANGAAFQPEWGNEGQLYFVLEDGNWSELFVHDPDGSKTRKLTAFAGELLRPLWGLGARSYTILEDGRIILVVVSRGEQQLRLLDPVSGETSDIKTRHRQIHDPETGPDGKSTIAIAHDDAALPSIVAIGLDGSSRTLSRPGIFDISVDDTSVGETCKFDIGEKPVYAVIYEPRNAKFAGPDGDKPPLIISAHGGPTGSADRGLKAKIQYWTSRGFAFADVDYRGSTGYGRDYRNALDGQWGVADTEDVLAVAAAIIAEGRVDPAGIFISGGSAGGFTVLNALVAGSLFAGGCVSYGVSDLASLLATTHKFEAGYLYGLTGTEDRNTNRVFDARSPLLHADKIKSPVLFLQGLDDKVVPPEQSRAMFDALRENGIETDLMEFEREGHGFRSNETICAALRAEYRFYLKCLGLDEGATDA